MTPYALAFTLIALTAPVTVMASDTEEAKYTIAENAGAIEIRDYAPHIVAETQTRGERKEAISKGFRIIADYIFGNNIGSAKIAMTAPVLQQSGEKIPMTAPVTQQGAGENVWNVRFIMPCSATMETLPKPVNSAVTLKEIPAKRYAVIRFSGLAGKDRLAEEQTKLDEFLKTRKLQPESKPVYAFFNPPWTLPFLRRNEIMMEIPKP